jgi:hypothetical protein
MASTKRRVDDRPQQKQSFERTYGAQSIVSNILLPTTCKMEGISNLLSLYCGGGTPLEDVRVSLPIRTPAWVRYTHKTQLVKKYSM